MHGTDALTEGEPMRKQAKQRRENRTITIDFQNEATYFQLLGDGKAFLELVMAFLMSLGFQLKHKATCGGPSGPVSDAWRAQFGAVRGDLRYLPHGALPSGLCARAPESGGGADTV